MFIINTENTALAGLTSLVEIRGFLLKERKILKLTINYSKQAIKFLSKQDKPTKIRIVNAINNLPSGDVKKLQGRSGYRLRVGDYRIIFDKDGNVLFIEKIDNRGQIYK